jgi:DNA polymerase-3 subunit beta
MATATRKRAEAPPVSFTVRSGQAALLEVLQRAMLGSGRRSTFPVLECVRIQASSAGMVSFTMTDLDQRVTASAPIESAGPGIAIVPAKRLAAIVASLSTGVIIELELVGTSLRVRSGRSKFELPGFPAEEFPAEQNAGAGFAATIETKALAAAIRKVVPFLERDQGSRPWAMGALLDPTPQGLVLVGTNGHRIARVLIGDTGGLTTQCVIPGPALQSIDKLFANDATVTVSGDTTAFVIAGARATLRSRLIEGPYPPYQHIFAEEPKWTVTVNHDLLVAGVKRVRLAAENDLVKAAFGPDVMQLTARSEKQGEAEDYVECRIIGDVGDSEPPQIAFSADYLLDALASIGADEHGDTALQLRGAERIMYIRPGDSLASLTAAGVMPRRILDGGDDE